MKVFNYTCDYPKLSELTIFGKIILFIDTTIFILYAVSATIFDYADEYLSNLVDNKYFKLLHQL